jgi:flagellar basal body rod protein FlgC
MLIPVGAALIARERLVAEVSDAIANYNSTAKAGAQLRKFERRGTTARNRVERELRKTRVRVEREVRQTRTRVERELERRRREGEEIANRVQERLLELV